MSEKSEEGCLSMVVSLMLVVFMGVVVGKGAYDFGKSFDELKGKVKALEEKVNRE